MKQITPLKIAVFESRRTQRDIAAEAGMSESHLSRIVNGLHADDGTWDTLARVLGREVRDIRPAEPDQRAA